MKREIIERVWEGDRNVKEDLLNGRRGSEFGVIDSFIASLLHCFILFFIHSFSI